MPVIPVLWEAEAGGWLRVSGQLTLESKTLSQKNKTIARKIRFPHSTPSCVSVVPRMGGWEAVLTLCLAHGRLGSSSLGWSCKTPELGASIVGYTDSPGPKGDLAHTGRLGTQPCLLSVCGVLRASWSERTSQSREASTPQGFQPVSDADPAPSLSLCHPPAGSATRQASRRKQ